MPRKKRQNAASRVRCGLEQLLTRPGDLAGRRLGLIANPTCVTADLLHGALALKDARAFRLAALFGPEHGIWADAQDLVEVDDSRDRRTGLPVYSLYGRTRVPTREMLQGLDALVYDLQDVGSRYYTPRRLLEAARCSPKGLGRGGTTTTICGARTATAGRTRGASGHPGR